MQWKDSLLHFSALPPPCIPLHSLKLCRSSDMWILGILYWVWSLFRINGMPDWFTAISIFQIDCLIKLSGMPDLTLTFVNPRLLDDVSFHPCVRFKRWEVSGLIDMFMYFFFLVFFNISVSRLKNLFCCSQNVLGVNLLFLHNVLIKVFKKTKTFYTSTCLEWFLFCLTDREVFVVCAARRTF